MTDTPAKKKKAVVRKQPAKRAKKTSDFPTGPVNLLEDETRGPLDGKIILVNVGSEDHPATDDDIEKVKNSFIQALEASALSANSIIYVGDHTVRISIMPF